MADSRSSGGMEQIDGCVLIVKRVAFRLEHRITGGFQGGEVDHRTDASHGVTNLFRNEKVSMDEWNFREKVFPETSIQIVKDNRLSACVAKGFDHMRTDVSSPANHENVWRRGIHQNSTLS